MSQDREFEVQERLIERRNIAITMLTMYVNENAEVFQNYYELLEDVNKLTKALEVSLKDIQEETMVGEHRRSPRRSKRVRNTETFLMAYGDVVRHYPNLIGTLDVKAIESAIAARLLPEEANKHIETVTIWSTSPKPKPMGMERLLR